MVGICDRWYQHESTKHCRLHVIRRLKTLSKTGHMGKFWHRCLSQKICRVTLTPFFFFTGSHGLREESKHAEEEMESEKEEEDSEEEIESSRTRPEQQAAVGGGEAAESAAPAMTKAQVRELRRVKKLDHSWLAGLLDSWSSLCTKTHTDTELIDSFHQWVNFFYNLIKQSLFPSRRRECWQKSLYRYKTEKSWLRKCRNLGSSRSLEFISASKCSDEGWIEFRSLSNINSIVSESFLWL